MDIHVAVKDESKSKLSQVTRCNIGKRVAIIVNGEEVSAPRVLDELTDGLFIISVGPTKSRAENVLSSLGGNVPLCGVKPLEAHEQPEVTKIADSGLPLYPGARDAYHYTMFENIKGLNYVLDVPYPATEVLAFYDVELAKRGYRPYVEPWYAYADRKWRGFIDGTQNGEPYVWQMVAYWVDNKQERRANLALRYRWYPPEGDEFPTTPYQPEINSRLQVISSDCPFSEFPPPQTTKR